MANICSDSERAGHIISIITRLRFLPLKEKWLLLKHCPHKTLVGRLLGLAFDDKIFRLDLSSINKRKTNDLVGADERLLTFVVLHERLFNDEISIPIFLKNMGKIMKRIHVREYEFYDDLMSGGTCFLDFVSYRKFFMKKDTTKYTRFMRPCAANTEYAWGGKKFVVQPNYQGIQLRLVLEKGEKPKIVAGDQIDYASRMKGTLKTASGFLNGSAYDRIEFDGILIPKDKKNRPPLDWKAKECQLYLYDYVNEYLPLKKRLKVVAAFCDYMKKEGNKRVVAMPSETLSGPLVTAAAKSYSRASNPYCSRNGVIVKRWDSAYEFKRSPDWLTLTAFNDRYSGEFFGRATILGVSQSLTKIFAIDNNGLEIEIEINPIMALPLSRRYIGYTVEFSLSQGYYKFRRVLYDKGREV